MATLVMEEANRPFPVTEEMVLAALLRDVAENHGGRPHLREVEATYGATLAVVVTLPQLSY